MSMHDPMQELRQAAHLTDVSFSQAVHSVKLARDDARDTLHIAQRLTQTHHIPYDTTSLRHRALMLHKCYLMLTTIDL